MRNRMRALLVAVAFTWPIAAAAAPETPVEDCEAAAEAEREPAETARHRQAPPPARERDEEREEADCGAPRWRALVPGALK